MTSFAKALLVSLACHLAVAAGLAFWIGHAPQAELAQLDLSSVELSFAEDADESAQQSPMPPSQSQEGAPEPRDDSLPKADFEFSVAAPELVDDMSLPEPTDEPPQEMVPPVNVDGQFASVVPASDQARIDAPPKPERPISVRYPTSSRRRGEAGDVQIDVSVNAQGRVDDAAVVRSSGYAELDASALKAVRSAKFSPAMSGETAVGCVARLTISFRLDAK